MGKECGHAFIDAFASGGNAWHILVNMLEYQCYWII